MELSLRRSYGYAFAPPLNRWGMAGLGDDGSGETVTEGGGTIGTPDNSSGETDIPLYVAPIGTTLTTTPTYSGAPIAIVDSSGNSWNCDANGNCCDASGNCQQGPPTILSSTPPNATVGQSASATAANQSAAQLVAALASAAAAVGKSVVGTPGSIQCSTGVAVAAGQRCPGAVGTSVCPPGLSLIGGSCSASSVIPGLSNTMLVIIAALGFFLLGGVSSPPGGRR